MKFVENVNEGFELFLKTKENLAIVTDRIILQAGMKKYGMHLFHLPPEKIESSFGLRTNGIALPKNSIFKKHLDFV